nr:MAG TPA: hypothetical protein [Caudoviricetes sp.]DAS96373.1 MAG TPA: hypothetical protein [Caudoviricetes sp.]DAT13363.1 MAG TPA: hypothetical protein [Caudoviricetes sp.]DAU20107.1 MAG TPA: hypothetical protein [Caudoviricetes sp.]
MDRRPPARRGFFFISEKGACDGKIDRTTA